MNNMNIDAFLNGFIKAAELSASIPPVGAPNITAPSQPIQPGTQPMQPNQPQPGQQTQQVPQLGQQGGQPNQMFYQLMNQFKQQNPMPVVPPPVNNMHMTPQ